MKSLLKELDQQNAAKMILAVAKVVGQETLEEVGRQLVSLHKPANIDYRAKFGVAESLPAPDAKKEQRQQNRNATNSPNICRQCGSTQLSIVHGKYGYYFKCADCDGNTPIKIGCGHVGHKERIRKAGPEFFRECAECGTSSVFYKNAG